MKFKSTDRLFFTSDCHFFHSNIVDYCKRPFINVDEMDEALVANWNAVVPTDGITFITGDFAFTGNVERLRDLLGRLNGEKHLILGNHDYNNKYDRKSVRELFTSVNDYLTITIKDSEVDGGKQVLFLCHYPLLTWYGADRGSWNIHGHLHSTNHHYTGSDSSLITMLRRTQLDVGVDLHDFKPLSYQQIKIIITQRHTIPIVIKPIFNLIKLINFNKLKSKYYDLKNFHIATSKRRGR